MKITTIIAFSLVLLGSIVWLLIGLFNINIVSLIFGTGMAGTIAARVIYSIVGVAALWMIFYWIMYDPFSKTTRAH